MGILDNMEFSDKEKYLQLYKYEVLRVIILGSCCSCGDFFLFYCLYSGIALVS